MRLNEIPVNTLVELKFEYFGEKHKVITGLLYKYANTVYVSALKEAGEVIPAKKFKNFCLIFKTESAIYTFKDLEPRSVSFSGQHLYAVRSEQDAEVINYTNTFRLFVGVPITPRIIKDNDKEYMNCMLKDIGMTGMSILSLKKIDEQSKIEISFRVNYDTVETLTGNIVQSLELKNGKGYLYECEFDEPNESIGKYVLRQQMEIDLNKTRP